MPVSGVPRFERFFREAAGLDVDKADVKRHGDFVTADAADPGFVRTALHRDAAGAFGVFCGSPADSRGAARRRHSR